MSFIFVLVSDLLEIFEYTFNRDNLNLWLICAPITERPPADVPEMKNLSNNYWSAKVIVEENGYVHHITDWFSIPLRNIRKAIDASVMGRFAVQIRLLSEDNQEEILQNTTPTFSLKDEMDADIRRWLTQQNDMLIY